MKCSKCGEEIANDSVFCEYCGTKVKSQRIRLLSQCNTWQKVSIVLLLIWFLFAIVVCANTFSDFGIITLSSICCSLSTIIIISAILLKVSLDNQPFAVMQPNDETPGVLLLVFIIGQIMMRSIKFRKSDDTWVSYTFFFFFFLIFPTGCYRINQNSIYGSETTNWQEIAYIYMIIYGGSIWLTSSILLLISLYVD